MLAPPFDIQVPLCLPYTGSNLLKRYNDFTWCHKKRRGDRLCPTQKLVPSTIFDIPAPLSALAGLVGVLSRWQVVTMSSVVITLASLKITTPTPLIINYYGWGVWMIIISRPPRRSILGRRAIAARSSKRAAPVHPSLPRRAHSVTFWCLGGGFEIYAKSWL